jgi:hypothetical protein
VNDHAPRPSPELTPTPKARADLTALGRADLATLRQAAGTGIVLALRTWSQLVWAWPPWSRYAVEYAAEARLLDVGGGRALWAGRCLIEGRKVGGSTSWDDLRADDGALLEAKLNEAADARGGARGRADRGPSRAGGHAPRARAAGQLGECSRCSTGSGEVVLERPGFRLTGLTRAASPPGPTSPALGCHDHRRARHPLRHPLFVGRESGTRERDDESAPAT